MKRGMATRILHCNKRNLMLAGLDFARIVGVVAIEAGYLFSREAAIV